jgi:REP element-mobilizing transposase RayT
VSTRILPGLPSLRGRRLWQAVRRALALCCAKKGFRIVHFSVQGQHIHLICEADDRRALSRGMQGFKTSVARRLNRACERRGVVFADRYHERIIQSPTDCRHTVAYVNPAQHPSEECASYPAGRSIRSARGGLMGGPARPWGGPSLRAPPLVAAPKSGRWRGGWWVISLINSALPRNAAAAGLVARGCRLGLPAAEGAVKRYGEFTAVRGCRWRFRLDHLGDLGPNGAGRGRALRMVNDILARRGAHQLLALADARRRGGWPAGARAKSQDARGGGAGVLRRAAWAAARGAQAGGAWPELELARWAQQGAGPVRGMQKVQFAAALPEPELLVLTSCGAG